MYKLHIIYINIQDSWKSDIANHLNAFWDRRIKPVSKVNLELTSTDHNIDTSLAYKHQHWHSGNNIFGVNNGRAIAREVIGDRDYHEVMLIHDPRKAINYNDVIKGSDNNRAGSWMDREELKRGNIYTEVQAGSGLSRTKDTVTHETMHCLCWQCYYNGVQGNLDHMDRTVIDGEQVAYYKNNNPDHVDGNYSRTINAISQANAWQYIESTKRFMKEFRLIKDDMKTVVVKEDGKWCKFATDERLWFYVKETYNIQTPLQTITLAEVQANQGPNKVFGIKNA